MQSHVGGPICFMRFLVIFSERSRVAEHTLRQRRFSSVLTNVAVKQKRVMIAASRQARRAQLGAAELAPRWESLFMPSWECQPPKATRKKDRALPPRLPLLGISCMYVYIHYTQQKRRGRPPPSPMFPIFLLDLIKRIDNRDQNVTSAVSAFQQSHHLRHRSFC